MKRTKGRGTDNQASTWLARGKAQHVPGETIVVQGKGELSPIPLVAMVSE